MKTDGFSTHQAEFAGTARVLPPQEKQHLTQPSLSSSAFLGTTAFPAPSRKVLAVLASGSLSALLTNASRTDQPRHGMHRAIRLFGHTLFLSQKALCQATYWLFSSSAALLPPVRQLVFVSFCGRQSSTGRNASGTEQPCT